MPFSFTKRLFTTVLFLAAGLSSSFGQAVSPVFDRVFGQNCDVAVEFCPRDCESVQFCIFNLPDEAVFVFVQTDNPGENAFLLVGEGPPCLQFSSCVNQITSIRSFDNTFTEISNDGPFFIPPFFLTGVPATTVVLGFNNPWFPSLQPSSQIFRVGVTQCVDPFDWNFGANQFGTPVDYEDGDLEINVNRAGQLFEGSFDPDNGSIFEFRVEGTNFACTQNFTVQISATASFCGGTAQGQFNVILLGNNSCLYDPEASIKDVRAELADAGLDEVELDRLVRDYALQNPGADVAAVTAFPNPTSGLLTVNYSSRLSQLRLVDLTGKTLRQLGPEQLPEYQLQLQLDDLPVGIYVLETVDAEGTKSAQRISVNR